ncbi:MAG: hypothetical protein NVS3B20_14640 [Polyangiales bacterium]
MKKLQWMGFGAVGVAACGGAARSPQLAKTIVTVPATPVVESHANVSPSPAQPLATDTAWKTSSGATFTAPKGWFVTTTDAAVVLEDPDRALKVTLIENQAADAMRAIEAGWKSAKPGFDRKVKDSVSPPPKDGWEAVTQNAYETGSREARTVIAIARKKGSTFYVTLIDGANAAFDRRGAQVMTAFASFKAKGNEEESFAGKTAHALDEPRLKTLEDFIEEARKQEGIPGVAVAIVEHGAVVFQKGFGVRQAGQTEKVTPNTLFMIGSTTKSLTTLLMAKLIDEGKFAWDTKVTQLMPSFTLGDPEATKKLTMQHTVCACAGLPRQDMEFFFEYDGVSPEQRILSMKDMKPTTGFGETFQYSNTMVALGGYAAAHALDATKALGPAYDQAMQSRVLDPLGMKSTTFDFSLAKRSDHATPHGQGYDLEFKPIPLKDEEGVLSVRPAGAAWSSVRDMARYVSMELAQGKSAAGTQYVSETNLLKRREKQIKISDKMSYGLGLLMSDDNGVRVVGHPGNNLGFTSDMYFLPDYGVGVVVLSNGGDTNAFRNAVKRRLLEVLFDGAPEAQRTLAYTLKLASEMNAKEVAKLDLHPSKTSMDALVHTFDNANLGKVTVRLDGDHYLFDAGEWRSAIAQKKEADGALKLVLTDAPFAGWEFLINEKEGRATLTLETPQKNYLFLQRKTN